MRKIILGLLLSICSVFHAEAQAPDWVTQRPTSSDAYIGIGVASLSETDYMKKATQNALLDIVSQIAVKLENNSFLHRVDVDGKTREMLEDKIHSSMVAWLEGQELKGSYQSEQKYYVYYAYVNVFSGMAITTNVMMVEGEAFKAIAEPIAGCLSKNGVVVPNVKLKASFASGNGTVSLAIQTDYTGTAEFYVTNITSKEEVQELRITIDDSFMNSLPEAYRQLLQNQTWPSAKVTISLKSAPITAYLYVNKDNELEGIERQISSLLTNNYFTLSEDPDAATCFVDLSTKLEMGEVVTGGTYDLNTCYCSLVLKIYNNKTQQMLLNYSVNQVKVLVPVNKSATASLSMCIREVIKRVNRELPAQIKKLKIN